MDYHIILVFFIYFHGTEVKNYFYEYEGLFYFHGSKSLLS